MTHNKLPADPVALILGIISLVLGITGCCCYGIPAVITLVLAIIGLVLANKSIREYKSNPDAFPPHSYNNVNTAKIINIIAIVFNGIIVGVILVIFIVYGTLMSAAVLEGIREGDFEYEDTYYEEYQWENDSIEDWQENDYIIEEATDSINRDSFK